MTTPPVRYVRRVGLPLAAILVLAACGSSASPTPAAASAAPASSAPTAAPASVEASSPAESVAIPSFTLPSFNADVDLEKQLPDKLGTATLQKFSFKGAEFLSSGDASTKEFTDLLGAIGKSPADLSMAIAADPTSTADVTVGAFKVSGADANVLLNAFIQSGIKQSAGATSTDVNISGKSVKKVSTPGDSSPTYAYAHGDIVFFVTGTDDALIAEALSKLP
jgi:hypothetical protein